MSFGASKKLYNIHMVNGHSWRKDFLKLKHCLVEYVEWQKDKLKIEEPLC